MKRKTPAHRVDGDLKLDDKERLVVVIPKELKRLIDRWAYKHGNTMTYIVQQILKDWAEKTMKIKLENHRRP